MDSQNISQVLRDSWYHIHTLKVVQIKSKAYWNLISEVPVYDGAIALLLINNIISVRINYQINVLLYSLKGLHKKAFLSRLMSLSKASHLVFNRLRTDLRCRVCRVLLEDFVKKTSKSTVLNFYLWQGIHRQKPNNHHRSESKILRASKQIGQWDKKDTKHPKWNVPHLIGTQAWGARILLQKYLWLYCGKAPKILFPHR